MTVETISPSESPTHLNLDIVRETNKVGARAWLNRYCQNIQTHVRGIKMYLIVGNFIFLSGGTGS
jgi:hypothetical protein